MSLPSFILTYHSLDASGSAISVTPEMFRAHMASLQEGPWRVVPLAEVGEPGTVALTFDDGFQNFYDQGLPVLRRYGFPATVFVVTGHCGRRNDWGGKAAPGLPTLPLMDWRTLGRVADSGVSLGAHTVNHPRLTRLATQEAERELSESQQELENRTGHRVETFAYPYGDVNSNVRKAAHSRFRFACTTDLQFLAKASDPLTLPRLDAYYLCHQQALTRIGKRRGRAYIAARRLLREAKVRLSF